MIFSVSSFMEKASIHTMFNILKRSFFERKTKEVAKALLGKQIVHIVHGHSRAGIIVETEAYFSGDPASHCFKGMSKSNSALFGPVGHAYVYFIYGNHFCLNIVAHSKEVPAGGILIRALEPTLGRDEMIKARHGLTGYQISNGPGKLTQALGITKAHNHKDLTIQESLFITEGCSINSSEIITTGRIGISQAKDKPLRFYIANNPWVSQLKHT